MTDKQLVERLEGELTNIACAAAHFDDKPHHLFSAIRKSIKDDPDWGERAVQFLDLCYENIHAWQKAERELAEARAREEQAIKEFAALKSENIRFRSALERIKEANVLDMNTMHPDGCQREAAEALTAPAPEPTNKPTD